VGALKRSSTQSAATSGTRHSGLRALLLALAACCFIPAQLQADAASGTYTGSISARGNYYFERSTRVIAPSTAITLETPTGVRIEGTYLIDAITSASQATGVVSDKSFTEVRNDVSGGFGYEFDLGRAQLDLALRGRFSKEPDYLSRGASLSAGLSLNQRLTVLSINGGYLNDDVGRVVRMVASPSSDQLVAAQRTSIGTLNVVSLGFALDQVLSATTTLTLGYDLALLDGFQANPYRLVAYQDGGAAAEHHPDQRTRQAYYFWLSQYVKATRSSVRVGYRFYRDNWDLLAQVPEVRIYQEIGPHVELRLRYRYYTQSSSFFFRPGGNVRADKYVTFDPKMTEFHDQTIGAKLRVGFEFLAFTPLDFFHTAALDFGVEYIFNTNRYGDGLVGQGGLSWDF
jgi:hypothetical protein